jgi:hypothetical protein
VTSRVTAAVASPPESGDCEARSRYAVYATNSPAMIAFEPGDRQVEHDDAADDGACE